MYIFTALSLFWTEPQVRAVKARLGCRGVLDTQFPSLWLSLTADKLKVEATKNKDSESTLFYLIPTGMREVCIQHISSRNFIAINHNGKLIAKASEIKT